MDSKAHFASPKKSGETNRMNSRRRPPLHTCAVSFLAISRKSYTKAQEFHKPIGTMVAKMAIIATLASPVAYPARYLFLATLSFLDDYILASEDIVGSLFPPSNYVFDKIDELVQTTETLPDKFDAFVTDFPSVIYQIPVLEWALVHVIAWLHSLVSFLANNTGEKDIMIDANYKEPKKESPTKEKKECKRKSFEEADIDGMTFKPLLTRNGSYKEVLEKGKKEVPAGADAAKKENVVAPKVNEKVVAKEKSDAKPEQAEEELNEGWLVNPKKTGRRKVKGRKKRGSMPRSASYTC